jgi:HEPN domain-containing protein
LKSYLIFKNESFPFTHDLVVLCDLCKEQNEIFEELLDDCSDLTPYATQARYPKNNEITEEETTAALRKAERLMQFVTSLIPAEA